MRRLVTTILFVSVVSLAIAADDIAAGRKLHTAKCARCHKLYDPAGYDQKTWDMWTERMRQKAHLNNDQYRQITAYLDSIREAKGAN